MSTIIAPGVDRHITFTCGGGHEITFIYKPLDRIPNNVGDCPKIIDRHGKPAACGQVLFIYDSK